MRSNTPIDSRITSSSSGVHAALWPGQRQGRAIYDEEQEGKDDNGDGGGWQSEGRARIRFCLYLPVF